MKDVNTETTFASSRNIDPFLGKLMLGRLTYEKASSKDGPVELRKVVIVDKSEKDS